MVSPSPSFINNLHICTSEGFWVFICLLHEIINILKPPMKGQSKAIQISPGWTLTGVVLCLIHSSAVDVFVHLGKTGRHVIVYIYNHTRPNNDTFDKLSYNYKFGSCLFQKVCSDLLDSSSFLDFVPHSLTCY